MTKKPAKATVGILPFLNKAVFWKKRKPSRVGRIHSKRKMAISPEKRAELEKLCEQLFNQKKHITSGKFQFIGLTKIKKRMGKNWAGLCKIVYDAAEGAIDKYIGPSDISIRYKDDTYVIIFAQDSLEEGKAKAILIASEIQRRLFELEEKDLKDIEVQKAIQEIKTDFLSNGFPDFLDSLDMSFEDDTTQKYEPAELETPVAETIEVNAEYYRAGARSENQDYTLSEDVAFAYFPLWDVPRNALTTYLCMSFPTKSDNNILEAHKYFYKNLSMGKKVGLDTRTLKHVISELAAMEKDGRKLLIACPVHYDTLYHFENYEYYKKILSEIPEGHKQFLVFLIMNMAEGQLPKDPYWFAAPLRAYCRHVFAEVPLRRDINFSYLRNSGVDVVGVRLDNSMGSEQEIINIINGFSSKAKALRIQKTFVLGLSSLSLTTSAVCAGFDFLGGQAIHDVVTKPDTIHKYRHEDLISNLASKE